MSLKIFYGSAVSEKTENIYDYLITESEKHPDRDYIMLVPEQASLTVQEELILRHPKHALFNIDVLTFNRLSHRVFQEVHDAAKDVLNDIGKLMLLRLVADRVSPKLVSLKRSLKKPGFLDEVKSVISELVQYGITPEMLCEKAENLSGHRLLQEKLQDIGLIYGEFMELLHRNYEMTEERTMRLSEALPHWEKASRTVIALDGFTGFTPPQYEVLGQLLTYCPEVILGATIGTGESIEGNRAEEALFCMSAGMIESAEHLPRDPAFVTERIYVPAEKKVSGEIRYLEKYLFRYGQEVPPFEGDPAAIRMLKVRSPKEETALAVSEILRGVREGMAWRDMAVILGDPESYRGEIEEQFTEAGIPYFLDAPVQLRANPLFGLVTAVLAAAEDFSFDDVMHYVKNPLVVSAVSGQLAESADGYTAYERIAEAENFALARGIRGEKAFTAEWTGGYHGFSEERLSAVNEVRACFTTPLAAAADGLTRDGITVSERLNAIEELLDTLRVPEKLAAMASETEDFSKKQEYLRSCEALRKLFAEIREILGDNTLPFDEFRDVLETGISCFRLGLVPPTKDRLVIGDLKRTRLGHIRRLFVIGANEGVLPPKQSGDGLLTDADREILKANELGLSPTAKEESFNMRFYLYLMLTRPSESVCITYAKSGRDGKTLMPGYLISAVSDLCGLKVTDGDESAADTVNSVSGGFRVLAEEMRQLKDDADNEALSPENTGKVKALYDWYTQREDCPERIRRITDSLFYEYRPETLPAEISELLYRELVKGSVSKLERYAACPFSHFLTYGLGLSERETYEIEAADLGTIYHDCIDGFFRKMKASGGKWYDASAEEIEKTIDAAVSEVTADYGNDILKDSARSAYLVKRIGHVVSRTVRTLRAQWNAGDFLETGTEVPFPDKETIPAIQIPLENGQTLRLEGRIDRLDLLPEDGRTYLKVIDYKTGQKDFSYTEIYYGLQLQLLVYLEAARRIAAKYYPENEILPAGVYYYHVDNPIVEARTAEDADELIEKELMMKGVTNADPEIAAHIDRAVGDGTHVVKGLKRVKDGSYASGAVVATGEELDTLLRFTMNKAKSLAEDMVSGKIGAQPYQHKDKSGCTYCDFRAVCGFDERIPGYRKRPLAEKTLADIVDAETDDEENV